MISFVHVMVVVAGHVHVQVGAPIQHGMVFLY